MKNVETIQIQEEKQRAIYYFGSESEREKMRNGSSVRSILSHR